MTLCSPVLPACVCYACRSHGEPLEVPPLQVAARAAEPLAWHWLHAAPGSMLQPGGLRAAAFHGRQLHYAQLHALHPAARSLCKPQGSLQKQINKDMHQKKIKPLSAGKHVARGSLLVHPKGRGMEAGCAEERCSVLLCLKKKAYKNKTKKACFYSSRARSRLSGAMGVCAHCNPLPMQVPTVSLQSAFPRQVPTWRQLHSSNLTRCRPSVKMSHWCPAVHPASWQGSAGHASSPSIHLPWPGDL